ncbi:unnamed protein product [Pedinophyceae sp. YPF-701]|nr:unnamed protein product [Pedinophyceae sp. YPF-701]
MEVDSAVHAPLPERPQAASAAGAPPPIMVPPTTDSISTQAAAPQPTVPRTVKLPVVVDWLPEGLHGCEWRLDEFDLLKKLGSGCGTSVYLAQERRSGFLFALKVYKRMELSARALAHLRREIRIHSTLQHPNIITMYSAFGDLDHVYIALEYSPRGDLFTQVRLLKGMRPTEAKVVSKVVYPILKTLAFLHARDIVHRDIKPENILYDADRNLKLADFGLAIVSTEEKLQSRIGTLEFMAPEILRMRDKPAEGEAQRLSESSLELQERGYTWAVDVWAIGVMVYELLNGRSPFHSKEKSTSTMKRAILKKDITWPEHFSPAAIDFLSRCLNRDHTQRPTAAQLLRHELVQSSLPDDERITASDDVGAAVEGTPDSSATRPAEWKDRDANRDVAMSGDDQTTAGVSRASGDPSLPSAATRQFSQTTASAIKAQMKAASAASESTMMNGGDNASPPEPARGMSENAKAAPPGAPPAPEAADPGMPQFAHGVSLAQMIARMDLPSGPQANPFLQTPAGEARTGGRDGMSSSGSVYGLLRSEDMGSESGHQPSSVEIARREAVVSQLRPTGESTPGPGASQRSLYEKLLSVNGVHTAKRRNASLPGVAGVTHESMRQKPVLPAADGGIGVSDAGHSGPLSTSRSMVVEPQQQPAPCSNARGHASHDAGSRPLAVATQPMSPQGGRVPPGKPTSRLARMSSAGVAHLPSPKGAAYPMQTNSPVLPTTQQIPASRRAVAMSAVVEPTQGRAPGDGRAHSGHSSPSTQKVGGGQSDNEHYRLGRHARHPSNGFFSRAKTFLMGIGNGRAVSERGAGSDSDGRYGTRGAGGTSPGNIANLNDRPERAR